MDQHTVLQRAHSRAAAKYRKIESLYDVLRPRLRFDLEIPPEVAAKIFCRTWRRAVTVSRGWRDFVELARSQGLFAVNVTSVGAGLGHSVVCTNHGVISFGCGLWGTLGHAGISSVSTSVHRPRMIEALEKKGVVAVAAGHHHSLACTRSGQLLTWGHGSHGQLGHGEISDAGDCVTVPRVVGGMAGRVVVQVVAGSNHAGVLTSRHELYTFGSGCSGQLGHGSRTDEKAPRRLQAFDGLKIVSVGCGGSHTVAVRDDGAVFTFGHRSLCGHGSGTYELVPRRVQALAGVDVADVAASLEHSAARTKTGQVYTWGLGNCGKLGHGGKYHAAVPRLVNALSDMQVEGIDVGANHSVAWTGDGKLLTWGWKSGGRLGHGPNTSSSDSKCLPELVRALAQHVVVVASAGDSHTLVGTAEGDLFVIGEGCGGLLGRTGQSSTGTPTKVSLDA